MATRNISITDEAYQRLKTLKQPNESFSVVITRLTGKRSMKELLGALSRKEADRLERNIARVHEARAKLDRYRGNRLREAYH